jgi:hypothetical protein
MDAPGTAYNLCSISRDSDWNSEIYLLVDSCVAENDDAES